jgi:hypothetical protein
MVEDWRCSSITLDCARAGKAVTQAKRSARERRAELRVTKTSIGWKEVEDVAEREVVVGPPN